MPVIPPLPDIRVTTTLNALDDAIGMLSELESGPNSAKGARRGRIDLAALLWEIAPTASISIDTEAGTEVFGEEAELRRMLHVLVLLANSAGGSKVASTAPIRIRREDDWIRIGVDLGPDVSATTDLERRWLSRMATQMGGRVELEGGNMALLLPADASTDQSEAADLRKELAQAQQLGEAYARELAAVFAAGDLPESTTAVDSPGVAARRFDLLVGFASAVHHALSPVFRAMKDDADRLGSGDAAKKMAAHITAGFEFVSELGRIATCPHDESMETVDLARAVRVAIAEAEGRAARHGVSLAAELPPAAPFSTRPRTLSVLLRELVDHAILATPRGGSVAIALVAEPGVAGISIRDGGTAVPQSAHADMLEHRVDPASLGRPPGFSLLVAYALAAVLDGSVRLVDSANAAVTELRLKALA
jgi:signal transduction histidine kinase